MQDNSVPQTLFNNQSATAISPDTPAMPAPTPVVPSLTASAPTLPPLTPASETPPAPDAPPTLEVTASPLASPDPALPTGLEAPLVAPASPLASSTTTAPITPGLETPTPPPHGLPPLTPSAPSTPPSPQTPALTPDAPTPPPAPVEAANHKLGFLSYLGILIIAPIMMRNGDTFLKFHNRQGLIYIIYSMGSNIVLVILGVVLGILGSLMGSAIGGIIAMISGLLYSVNGLFLFIAWIMGMINVGKDEAKPLPLIGKFADKLPETWG